MKTPVQRRYRISVRLQLIDRSTEEPLGLPFLYVIVAQICPEEYANASDEVKLLARKNFSEQMAHTYSIDRRIQLNRIYGEGKWKIVNLNDLKYTLIEDSGKSDF